MTKEERMKNLLTDPVYAILGDALSLGRSNIQAADEIIKAGVKTIQYREKHKSWREKYKEAVEIAHMCRESGVTFIMNDSVDLAIACGADGIHVGQDDAPAPFVRKLAGPDVIIGVSTNTRLDMENAVKDKADYIGLGPVFHTDSKKDAKEVVSSEDIQYALQDCPLFVVTIGGIGLDNINALYKQGFRSFAMISSIVSQDNIAAAVNNLRQELAK